MIHPHGLVFVLALAAVRQTGGSRESTNTAPPVPVVSAGQEGFQFRSPDGSFLLRLRAYLQADGIFVANERSQRGTSTFLMRRVRPVFEATMFERFDFKVMPDFGGGTTVLQDGYLDARFSSSFRLRAGKYKSPFGLERLVSATDLLFVERGLPTALAPNRDIGLMLHGELLSSRVGYQAGIFNGVVDGGSADRDEDDGKDFVGRLMLRPIRGSGTPHELGVGLAASIGRQEGTPTAPNLLTFQRPGRAPYFRFHDDGTIAGTTLAAGTHRRLSPQGFLYSGRLGLLWEYVWTLQEVRQAEARAAIDSRAWQVAGSWIFTGESASFRSVDPRRAFDPAEGAWGAFEIAARAGRITIDEEAFPVFADPRTSARAIWTLTVGFNWHLNRSVKVNLNYEEARFEGGLADGDRAVERDFLTRMQFSF